MKRPTGIFGIRIFAVLALTISMVVSGFAHRVNAAGYSPEVGELAAYGLTISDICGDQEPGSDLAGPGECQVCQLLGAAVLPNRVEALVQAPIELDGFPDISQADLPNLPAWVFPPNRAPPKA